MTTLIPALIHLHLLAPGLVTAPVRALNLTLDELDDWATTIQLALALTELSARAWQ